MLRVAFVSLLVGFASAALSMQWEACEGNSTGSVAFSSDFVYTDRCSRWSVFAPSTQRELHDRDPCFRNASDIVGGAAGVFACRNASQRLTAGYLCALGLAKQQAFRSEVSAVAASFNAAANCTDGLAEGQLFERTLRWLLLPDAEQTFKPRCQDSRVFLDACPGSAFVDLPFPSLPDDVCTSFGLRADCSPCQPFFKRDVVTQPYVFLLFPGLKLVAIKLLELFVLFKIAEYLRVSIEQRLREQPTDTDTHPPEFNHYVVEHLLGGGQRRIRQRLTSRNRDGKANIQHLLKRFQKEQSGTVTPLTQDDLAALVNAQGIVLQAASFPKQRCIAICVDELEKLGLVTRDDDDDTRDNDINDWFFDEVCAFGARCVSDTPANRDLLRENLQVQLDLLAQRRTIALAHQRVEEFLAHEDRRTNEPIAADDAVVVDGKSFVAAADAGTDGAPTEKTTRSNGACFRDRRNNLHHRRKKMNAVAGETFARDFIDRHKRIAEEQLTDRVIEVALRPVVAQPTGPLAQEHSVVCVESVTIGQVADSVAMAVADESAARRLRVDLFLPARTGAAETLSRRRRLRDLIDPDSTRLSLRFRIQVSEPSVASTLSAHILPHIEACESAHCFDPFDSIDHEIERVRDDFEARVQTTIATFDADWILRDTDAQLSRILDKRASTTILELVLALCGAEVIYECDITESERYELRDAIGQLRPENAEARRNFVTAHHVDPLASYHLCFKHLTAFHSWQGELRHGMLRCFDSERAQLVGLLESMYDAVKDRLLADGRNELAEAEALQLAHQFKGKIEDVSRLVPIVMVGEHVFYTIFAVNVYVLVVSAVFGIAYYSLSWVDGMDDPANTDWVRYQVVYFRFVNSGTPASLLASSSINMVVNQEGRFHSKLLAAVDWTLFGLSLTLVAPPLVTHVLPGMVAYFWIVASVVVLMCVPLCALRQLYMHKASKWEAGDPGDHYTESEMLAHKRTLKTFLTCMFMLLSFIIMVVLTAAFQSCFNWSFILYQRSKYQTDYISTLQFEAHGRTPTCYWEVAVQSAFNSMQLFSSFLG
uniref:Uncharacterized protein n=1 Tax=Neobodo designis TaxID=312471 RepID=A0A7S1M9J6_NEODS|mmetsp:Transcript_3673/g.11568  ORF Transcript_3673/g.11568 Transcript_3673/m.11568 type:complete len:1053 (+) Transcript_3673:25-3183(+)